MARRFHQPRKALIIGGGVAGPVAAMALQRAGIQAVVYEAYPPPAEAIGAYTQPRYCIPHRNREGGT